MRGRTVAGVRVNGLEETEGDPDVDRDDMEVVAERAVEDGAADRTSAEDHDLRGVRVLSREPERCRVLVVDLVDVLVERAPVQRLVHEEVEHVLKHEEEEDLGELLLPRREGHLPGRHAEVLRERVEQPDLCEGTRQTRAPLSQGCTQMTGEATRTTGSSTMKWEKRTCLVHSHCSIAVGIFVGWSFHLRKYGMASIMIHGTQRPKYTICGNRLETIHAASVGERTSCNKKLARPVARMGLLI